MFKVEHHNQGFRISIGDHRPTFARNVDAIHKALDHYFGGSQHVDNIGCPFCAQMAEQSRKAAQRSRAIKRRCQ